MTTNSETVLKPVDIFFKPRAILCDHCQKNLLERLQGMIISITKKGVSPFDESIHPIYKNIHFSCKGECERKLLKADSDNGLADAGWDDFGDYTNPAYYFRKLMAFINGIKKGKYENNCIEKMQLFFAAMFPYIAREMTDEEKERTEILLSIGPVIGL